jgi:hypothetical protein
MARPLNSGIILTLSEVNEEKHEHAFPSRRMRIENATYQTTTIGQSLCNSCYNFIFLKDFYEAKRKLHLKSHNISRSYVEGRQCCLHFAGSHGHHVVVVVVDDDNEELQYIKLR